MVDAFPITTQYPYQYHRIIRNNDNNNNHYNNFHILPTTTAIKIAKTTKIGSTSSTSLYVLLDVPDNFFSITFPVLGILLSLSKNFVRIRMEERAWEQRLEDSRQEFIKNNPTYNEYDLRKQEAALEYSAYGLPRLLLEQQEAAMKQQQQQRDNYDNDYMNQGSKKKKRRIRILDRDETDEEAETTDTNIKNRYRMNEIEIEAFEKQYGIAYDPYYDDPYTIDELPKDINYTIDKLYGDRIYEDGEIFYKDSKNTNLYWRQGSKPRNISFF